MKSDTSGAFRENNSWQEEGPTDRKGILHDTLAIMANAVEGRGFNAVEEISTKNGLPSRGNIGREGVSMLRGESPRKIDFPFEESSGRSEF